MSLFHCTFHALVGWVGEIKYGLIAAARGALTSWRPISLKWNCKPPWDTMWYVRYINTHSFIHSFIYLTLLSKTRGTLQGVVLQEVQRKHPWSSDTERELLSEKKKKWLNGEDQSITQISLINNAVKDRKLFNEAEYNSSSASDALNGWFSVCLWSSLLQFCSPL